MGSGDPLAQALLGIELTLLAIGVLLGGGAILVASLTATGKLHSRRPAEAAFGLMLLVGLLMSAHFYSPGREVGVAIVLLSAGTLLAHLRAESQEHP